MPIRFVVPLATMIVGFVIGFLLTPGREGPVISRDGRLIAGGALAHALMTQVTDEAPARGAIRIAQTFRDRDGVLCRSFFSAGDSRGFAGIACRDAEDWRIAMLTPMPPSQDAGLPALLRANIAARKNGVALSRAEERAAIANDWN